MSMQWTGVVQMSQNMALYGERAKQAAVQVAQYFAPVLETFAKQNAPWTDRTANARQSLHTWVEEIANDAVILYLAHGVDYGIFLEVRWAGKYAIIWPTIEEHLPKVKEMLDGIFS